MALSGHAAHRAEGRLASEADSVHVVAMAIDLPEGAPMRAYQHYIHELETLHGWLDVDLVHNGFLMTEEVGELFKAIRRYEGYFDSTSEREAARAHAGEEIVDVLNYLLAIANRLDIDVEAAFRAKNALNQTRSWSHRDGAENDAGASD